MGYKNKDNLTLSMKKKIQVQISHILLRYRKEKDLTQREMAAKVGYSLPRYRDFEKGLELKNLLIKSAQTLILWANAVEMEPQDFFAYLMDSNKPSTDEKGKGLLRWQKELLDSLKGVPQNIRRDWSIAIARNRKNERLEMMMENMTLELSLSKKEQDVINALLRVLVQGT